MAKATIKPTKATDTRIHERIRRFEQGHRVVTGQPMVEARGKCAAIFKRLLRDYDAETIDRWMDRFFAIRNDRWIDQRGYTVGIFYSYIPGFIVQDSKFTKTTAPDSRHPLLEGIAAQLKRAEFEMWFSDATVEADAGVTAIVLDSEDSVRWVVKNYSAEVWRVATERGFVPLTVRAKNG
jgi:hypothetical protein